MVFKIFERVSHLFTKYGIPEVWDVSRNLPGARGFAAIEYGPKIFILDPIQLIFCALCSTDYSECKTDV